MRFGVTFKSPLGVRKNRKFNATSVLAAGGEDFEIKSVATYNNIEKFNIGVIGSADTAFGTLSAYRENGAAFASQKYGGRWCYAGGSPDGAPAFFTNTVYYVSPKTGGTTSSWGTMGASKGYNTACANTFEGHIIAGVTSGGTYLTTIEKIWIMNDGSKTSFGTVSGGTTFERGEAYATKNMMYCVGRDLADQMEVKSFKSDGVMRLFTGIVGYTTQGMGFCCNDKLGLIMGGAGPNTNITQVVLANMATSTAFGSLTTARSRPATGCNQKRALFIKGDDNAGTETNNVEYVSFQSRHNSSSFGNLGTGKTNMDAYGAA